MKITLVPLEKSDFAAVTRLVEQADVSEFLVGSPMLGRERLQLWFDRSERAFETGRTGLFGIRESGALIGFAGLLILDPLRPFDEYLIYVIDEAHRRKGYATAAAQHVIAHARGTSTRKIIATVDDANYPSILVMKKLGFTDDGIAAGERGDLRLFTLKLK